MAGAVFNGRLLGSGDIGVLLSSASSSIDLRALAQVQPIELREEMLRIVTSAIQVKSRRFRMLVRQRLLGTNFAVISIPQSIWIVCTPCLGFAFLVSVDPVNNVWIN